MYLPPRFPAKQPHDYMHLFGLSRTSIGMYRGGGAVRIIRDHNLFLIECGIHIYLEHGKKPTEGYRLAADYCENYNPRYGNSLNGPSLRRLEEIIDFVHHVACREKVSV